MLENEVELHLNSMNDFFLQKTNKKMEFQKYSLRDLFIILMRNDNVIHLYFYFIQKNKNKHTF